MGFLDYFRHAPAWTAEELRRFLQENPPGDFNLIDVRQPREYDRGHLPGASLVPIVELDERLDEFDRFKTTIVYCGTGMRSEAAVRMLRRSGFLRTVYLEGGLDAWHGAVAKGRPEMVLTWFFPAHRTEEYIALAWYLEEGTRKFYFNLAERLRDSLTRRLYADLAKAEVEHEEMLLDLFRVVSGRPAGNEFPHDVIRLGAREEEFMEGGIPFSKALAWSQEKAPREILEFTIGLETGAYDRYLFMHDRLEENSARRVFATLAKAEKQHLKRMTDRFDHLLEEEPVEAGQAR